jgi:hypothetical protein
MRSGLVGLDAQTGEAGTEAATIGAQGFSGSGVIRDQARAQAAAIAPRAHSAADTAGVRPSAHQSREVSQRLLTSKWLVGCYRE